MIRAEIEIKVAQNKNLRKEMASRIKSKRKDKDVTQVQLSKMIEVPQSEISKIESGRKPLDVLMLLKIMESLQYQPKDVREVIYGEQ